jgi:hypothetical protein
MLSRMTSPFEGAYRKIRRARKHLGELDEKIRVFTNTEPYAVVGEFHTEVSKHPVRIHRQGDAEPSPQLPVIAGDAIHNLRTSLDHLVYALGERGSGAGPLTGFPVIHDPKEFRLKEETLLKGVPAPERARIEAVQPYNVVYDIAQRASVNDRNLPMIILVVNRLDNWDKHRLLLPIVGVAPSFVPILKGITDYEIEPATPGWTRMEDGAVLFWIIAKVIGPSRMEMESQAPYSVVFGNPDTPITDPLKLWEDRWTGAVSVPDLELFADIFEGFIRSFEATA